MNPETITVNSVNLELMLCTEVLKLNSLHYGYWKKNEELNLKNLRIAQKRYTDHLLKLIPKGTKSVLDVGAGIGDNSLALATKGYNVISLSPDKNHKKYFGKYKDKNIKFLNVKFNGFL